MISNKTTWQLNHYVDNRKKTAAAAFIKLQQLAAEQRDRMGADYERHMATISFNL